MSDNPPAFPSEQHETRDGSWNQTYCPGMSLRDWFAGQALMGVGQEYLHRNGFHGDTLHQNLAIHAYRIADAMLAERARGQGK
jgi:hypothetical protein